VHELPIPRPHLDTLFFVVEYLGVFVGALSGALTAIRDSRYRYDVVGVVGLSMATALGGGITRDVILQHGTPLAFENIWYLITALAGAGAAIHFGARMGKWTERTMIIIDAAAIGLFSVAGTTRALDAGLRALPSVLLGVVTAVGGGSLRDVLSGRPPKIFERGQLYAIAALLGSAVYLTSDTIGLHRSVSAFAGTFSCFALRVLAWRYDWRTRPIEFDQVRHSNKKLAPSQTSSQVSS
jgi:uncharacterized membrane protein YeiH